VFSIDDTGEISTDGFVDSAKFIFFSMIRALLADVTLQSKEKLEVTRGDGVIGCGLSISELD
jgi:hypothetical protein